MRAARLHGTGADPAGADLRIEELPTPEPGPAQVLVEIRACGVCGRDLDVVTGRIAAGALPLTIGHEAAGVIAAVGERVEGWRPGDRVALHAGWSCGSCAYCTTARHPLCREHVVPGVHVDGFQASHALTDPRWLSPLPGSIDFPEAAILADAVATPYHALKRAGIGDRVVCAVFGLGGLGLHAVQLARLAGGVVIGVDVADLPLERARGWGAEEVVDAREGPPHERIRALTDGGVDSAVELVGSPETVEQAVRSLKPGGRAAIAGLIPGPVELPSAARLVADELEIVGSFGAAAEDVNELIDLAEAGRLDLTRSVTHRIELEELPRALGWLDSREERPVRAVVTHPPMTD